MIIAITCVIAIAVIAFILGVRPRDLPAPEPESPFRHLDERKAAIYENLRDLQFEYRVGKLSDEDYQTTKKDLQKQLAGVLAEVDKIRIRLNGAAPPKGAPKVPERTAVTTAGRGAAVPPERTATPLPGGTVSAPSDGATTGTSSGPEGKPAFTCDSCGATFEKDMKFCGECGKPMKVAQ